MEILSHSSQNDDNIKFRFVLNKEMLMQYSSFTEPQLRQINKKRLIQILNDVLVSKLKLKEMFSEFLEIDAKEKP